LGKRNSHYLFLQQQKKTKFKSISERDRTNKKKKKNQDAKKIYRQSDIYFWSREVRMSDNYHCVYCNTSKKLSAHHIFPKSKYPELKFNLSNGILLCKKCHDEIHKLNDITNKTIGL